MNRILHYVVYDRLVIPANERFKSPPILPGQFYSALYVTKEPFVQAIFERLLRRECALPVTARQVREAVLANRFESVTNGRRRGQEDASAHERKGISGDWRNRFSDRVKRAFKDRFGELLRMTGYEKNPAW